MPKGTSDYQDRILIKLRRKYSKDEIVQALDKKIEALEIEKGQLLSEIDHLKHTISEIKQKDHTEISRLFRESAMYREQQKMIKERGKSIRELYNKISILSSQLRAK